MYQINFDRILFTQLGNDGIVYDIVTNEYLGLNETAFQILKGIEMGKNIDQIQEELQAEFEIDDDYCKVEIAKAISQMLQQNIIK